MGAISRMEADLAVLNSRFGAAGRIVFRPGANDLPLVVLAAPNGACEVSLYGAHVLSYRPTGHAPVLFMSREAVFEPGKPIRGGIPVCWPWFGAAPAELQQQAVENGAGALPQHGFARTTEWRVSKTSYAAERTELQLELSDSAETRKLFPFKFLLTLDVALDKQLSVELTVRNMDEQAFMCSECLHAYFNVMDITRAGIKGITPETLFVAREVDQGFDVGEDGLVCDLLDGGLRRGVRIEADDAACVQVWNPWIEKSQRLTDFGNDEYLRMVCVEPGNFGAHYLELQPGDAHTLSLRLTADLIAGN